MRFMVTIHFQPQGPEQMRLMNALIPAEQAHVRELMERGTMEAMHLSADFSTVWLVMQAETADEVQQELTRFPLYPFMRPAVTPLTQPRPVE